MKSKIKSKNFLPEPERSNTYDHIFTTVQHDPELREHLKEAIKTFPFWAYIDHYPDFECEREHTHFYIQVRGSYKLKTIANRLGVANNFIQFVDNPRSMMRYFLHLDQPEKTKYKLSDVVTNQPSRFRCATIDNQDDDVNRLYHDLDLLACGKITRDDFVSMHYLQIQDMPFINKIKTYEVINKLAVRNTT